MSTDVVLLILRGITSLVLLGFVGAVFWVLWRDYRLASSAAGEGRRHGRLVVVQAGQDIATASPGDGDTPTTELSGTAEAVQAALQVGELAGASFPLLPLTSLGRAPTNTVVLNDTFCSQEHALVTRRGGQWWLEDRNSSNGTRLNGLPVNEPVVLSSGDVIGIGRVQLKIELE